MSAAHVLELVRRMRRGAFSRNRNFDEFAGAEADGPRARRLWRFLRSLERDLARVAPEDGHGVDLTIEPDGGSGGRRLVIEVPALRLRRVARLSAEEYGLLREHPEARAALDLAETRTGT